MRSQCMTGTAKSLLLLFLSLLLFRSIIDDDDRPQPDITNIVPATCVLGECVTDDGPDDGKMTLRWGSAIRITM
jgi:hypothetical protein